MGRLTGQYALVTGAARGIGRAIALSLAAEGAGIAALDICEVIPGSDVPSASRISLEETVSSVRALDVPAIACVADVRQEEQMARAVTDAVDALGGLDIVVANAGGGAAFTNFWEVTEQSWDIQVDVNLKGAWITAKSSAPHLINQRRGRIVFVASQAGLRGYPGIAPYCAAKFGMIGLMKSVAIELSEYGINVNAVCPGSVDTEGNRAIASAMGVSFEEMVTAFTSKQLINKVMDPMIIGRAVVYLASPDGDFITGHALAVDGGATSK